MIFLILGGIFILPFIFLTLKNYIDMTKEEQIKVIEKILFDLVLQAQRYYGTGTGTAKFNFVVKEFYNKTPVYMQKIISYEKLTALIEEAVQEMNAYISENKERQKLV